jgi:hypothetical protein
MPELWEFPSWALDADLLFADAAGWNRPLRFAGGRADRGQGGEVDADARPGTAR